MSDPSAPLALTAHLALVSSISFGGFPTVLPDVRNFVVGTHRWMTDQDFANIFAMAQSVPGPNMILMMSFVGWKVWGLPGAVVSAFATFGPPCTIYFAAYRLWDRFRDAPWQQIVGLGLVPVIMGLVIASGTVMARSGHQLVGCCSHYRRSCNHADDPVQPNVGAARGRRSGWLWPFVTG
jgi:chromate transporter